MREPRSVSRPQGHSALHIASRSLVLWPRALAVQSAIIDADMKTPDPVPHGPEGDWLRLNEVFEGARVLPADRRPAYLAAACHDNPALLHEVEQLIASYERADTFLEKPIKLFDENTGTDNLP